MHATVSVEEEHVSGVHGHPSLCVWECVYILHCCFCVQEGKHGYLYVCVCEEERDRDSERVADVPCLNVNVLYVHLHESL